MGLQRGRLESGCTALPCVFRWKRSARMEGNKSVTNAELTKGSSRENFKAVEERLVVCRFFSLANGVSTALNLAN